MKSKRVLFISVGYPPIDIGGAERQCKLQAEYLSQLGNRVSVVTQKVGFCFSIEMISGIKVYRIPRPRKKILGTLVYSINLGIFLFLKAWSTDVFHVHLANLQAEVAVLIGKITGTPVHVKLAAGGSVGEISRFRNVPFLKSRFGITRAESVQAISTEIANELVRLPVAKEKIVTIPNGVSIPQRRAIEAIRTLKREEERVSEDCTVFLFLGRISSYKGIEILIEAWKDRMQVSNSKLFIVGPIAIDSPLNLMVEDSSIIVKPGTLRPEDYLAMTDVFVLPSLGEGMSNSLLEAMSFGKAVIVTRVGAAEELIENNYSGLLVDPANVSQLKTALNTFLSDSILRKECGENAQKKCQEYAITNVASAIDIRYQQLLNQNKSFLRNFKN